MSKSISEVTSEFMSDINVLIDGLARQIAYEMAEQAVNVSLFMDEKHRVLNGVQLPTVSWVTIKKPVSTVATKPVSTVATKPVATKPVIKLSSNRQTWLKKAPAQHMTNAKPTGVAKKHK